MYVGPGTDRSSQFYSVGASAKGASMATKLKLDAQGRRAA